jgi:DNA-3-methyladenine glycosylase II
MSWTTACHIGLPAGFRHGDVLAFHRRDTQQLSERVDGATLQKGVTWSGKAARLTLRFGDGRVDASLFVDDDAPRTNDRNQFERMVRRMLGLTQRIDEFERACRAHPEIGELIVRNSGLRVSLTPTPFEALAWAIVGQMISVSAAVSIRRRLIQAAAVRHSSGMWCFPDAGKVAAIEKDVLLGAGLSRSKADSLTALSGLVATESLPLGTWIESPPADEIRERLLAVRGIGPWTANYVLLRGFGFLDGSLHGDVAVRRNLQALLGREDKVGEDETKQWLAQFSPWRALVAAHLWAMNKVDGY